MLFYNNFSCSVLLTSQFLSNIANPTTNFSSNNIYTQTVHIYCHHFVNKTVRQLQLTTQLQLQVPNNDIFIAENNNENQIFPSSKENRKMNKNVFEKYS